MMEVTRIESCPCGWHGVKKLLIPETYEKETLAICPKCSGVVYVEVSKDEYVKRHLEVFKTGDKNKIADFLKRIRVRNS